MTLRLAVLMHTGRYVTRCHCLLLAASLFCLVSSFTLHPTLALGQDSNLPSEGTVVTEGETTTAPSSDKSTNPTQPDESTSPTPPAASTPGAPAETDLPGTNVSPTDTTTDDADQPATVEGDTQSEPTDAPSAPTDTVQPENGSTEGDATETGVVTEDGTTTGEPAADPSDQTVPAADGDQSAANSPDTEPALPAAAATETSAQLTSMATTDPLAGKTFVLEHGAGGTQTIYTAGNRTANGTNVLTYAWVKRASQKWRFVKGTKVGSVQYYYILRSGTNRALTVQGGKAQNNANVYLWQKGGRPVNSQLWAVTFVSRALGKVKICSRLSRSYVLTIRGSARTNATNVILRKDTGASGQRFYLLDPAPKVTATTNATRKAYPTGTYRITLATNDKLSVSTASAAEKANARLATSSTSLYQRVILRLDSAGFYMITPLGSGKLLTVVGGSIIPGTNVYQTSYNGTTSQRWAIHVNANGSLSFVNRASGLALDFSTASAQSGTNLRGHIAAETRLQRFKATADATPLLQDGYYVIKPITAQTQALSMAQSSKAQLVTAAYSAYDQTQKFLVERQADGKTYRILSAGYSSWLQSTAGKPVTQSGQRSSDTTTNSLWRILYDASGYWALKNVSTGQVLSLTRGATEAGTVVRTMPTGNATDTFDGQHFLFVKTNLVNQGVYNMRSYTTDPKVSRPSLAIYDNSTLSGANVLLADYAASKNYQKYRLVKKGNAFQIINYRSGHALTPVSGDEGANVNQRRLDGSDAQLWVPQLLDYGYLAFVNKATGMALCTTGDAKGDNVVQNPLDSSSSTGRECWNVYPANGNISYAGIGSQASTRVLMLGNSFTLYNNLQGTLQGLLDDAEVVVHAIRKQNLDWLLTHTNNAAEKEAEADESASQVIANATGLELLDPLKLGGDWDYVIIQEHSTRPIEEVGLFLASVESICQMTAECGALPILYGTWAYRGSTSNGGAVQRMNQANQQIKENNPDLSDEELKPLLATLEDTLSTMHDDLQEAFEAARNANPTLTLANVGDEVFADPSKAAAYLSDEEARARVAAYQPYDKALYSSDDKHPSVAASQLAAHVLANAISTASGAVSSISAG